jgi:hypothetical protein
MNRVARVLDILRMIDAAVDREKIHDRYCLGKKYRLYVEKPRLVRVPKP